MLRIQTLAFLNAATTTLNLPISVGNLFHRTLNSDGKVKANMLALNNLPKYESEKTTKILKPWLNVINDCLVILLLTVPLFVGGMELASGKYICLPVVDCPVSTNDTSKYKHHNVCRVFYSSQKLSDTNEKTKTVVTKLEHVGDYDYVNSECRKTAFLWFHSYFSLLLFGQAFILLLVNNVWLKNPWTASSVNSFYALAEECYNSPGAQFTTLRQSDKEQERNQGEDSVGVDLATTVVVKTLYEKIRLFNDYIRTSHTITNLYLFQACLQFLLTVLFLILNFWFKDIKGTARCSLDEYFPVIYEYITCSHNLSTLLESALEVFLCILVVLLVVSISIVGWTIHKAYWTKEYFFPDELKQWRIPSDLKRAEGDMGFLLHLLHAYDQLYSVQFAIYMSEKHNRKFYTVILDNEWPVEKLERCLYHDKTALSLSGLCGIPNSLFQFDEITAERLKELRISGCGPPQDFDPFGKFTNLSTLSLVNCSLTKIPKELFRLYCLRTLCLTNNLIKIIPQAICNLKKLCNFNISRNELESIDKSIKTLQLRKVDISNNPKITVDAVRNLLACKTLITLTYSDSQRFSNDLAPNERAKLTKIGEKVC